MNDSVKAIETAPGWQTFGATIVPGHRVASGENLDPRFPGGTIRMQIPHFQEMGLDLSSFYPGTINISIAPLHYQVQQAYRTLRAVKWHPTEPAEDFSFFEAELIGSEGMRATGFIYYPHPDTKPEHFQQADVLELLLPHVAGLAYGDVISLRTRTDQILIKEAVTSPQS
ncbi:hypothetical protein HHL09_04805 [Luteolibacter luteus]|uniref:Uncharacterized protein n=2 Tax=Luteolibacter luteus TaxID=2728835 RepID=A0A858RE71_9BACT|nr:hypothetical protein HHL09_04805 [Luteolibacter luteus]